jgi:hypothetical protein
MKVICINDKNLPNELPLSKRVKEGEVYTVLDVITVQIPQSAEAFVLEEINLTGYDPYKGFLADRFEIDNNWINELIEERELQNKE